MLQSECVRRFFLPLWLPVTLAAQFTTHLAPETAEAFENYRATAERQMTWQARSLDPRMRIDPFTGSGSTHVRHGLIHDWVASTLVPNTAPGKLIAVLEDYANYKTIYAPGVLDAKVLSRDDGRWHVYIRLFRKKVISVTLDSEYDVEFRKLDQSRWTVTSRSTKFAEVDGARALPPGEGHGFLWSLNAYWLIEQRPQGVYLECRTLSLTRDVPAALGWIVRPMVSSLPRESLRETLEATIRALR